MKESKYLERILGIVCSVFDAYSAVLFLPKGERGGGGGKDVRLASVFSLGDKISPDTTLAPGKGLVGWIVKNKKPLLVNNFDQSKSRLGYYANNEEASIKAFVGCPLAGGGALCLDSKRTYSFSDKDQKILHLFADLIQDMSDQCCRMDETQDQCRYYAAIRAVQGLRAKLLRWQEFLQNFLALVAETTRFGHCFLAVRDEFGERYFLEGWNSKIFDNEHHDHRFDLGSGLVGWVFKNGQPVYSGDAGGAGSGSPLFARDVKTPAFNRIICLPIGFKGETRAVLGLACTEPEGFDQDLKIFMGSVADHLSLFLENLYLRSRLAEIPTTSPHNKAEDDEPV